MKKVMLIISLLSVFSVAQAELTINQRVYLDMLKAKNALPEQQVKIGRKWLGGKVGCKNYIDIAYSHSQSEWSAINDNKQIKGAILKICPNAKTKKMNDRGIKRIFGYLYHCANDAPATNLMEYNGPINCGFL
ncbi:MAG: hypothetical protein GY814_13610 [Gammaproteobacteria bacterium]|nr:hypothetical protein [Gammaproteobacteria bacterium]